MTYARSRVAHDAGAGDAHFCAYSVPGRAPPRDRPLPRDSASRAACRCSVLILDIDCAAAPAEPGGTEGVRADDAYGPSGATRIAYPAHPNGVWYRTRGGSAASTASLVRSRARGLTRSRGGSSTCRRRGVARSASGSCATRRSPTGPAFIVCPSSPAMAWRRTDCSATARSGTVGRTGPRATRQLDLAAALSLSQYARSHGPPRRRARAGQKDGASAARTPPGGARVWSGAALAVERSCNAPLDLGRASRALRPPRAALALAGACYRAACRSRRPPSSPRDLRGLRRELTIGLRCGRRRRPTAMRRGAGLIRGCGRLRRSGPRRRRRRRRSPRRSARAAY